MPIEHCQQLFDRMVNRFDPEGAGDWQTTIQFKLDGPKGGNWVLKVADGKCEVTQGETENPTATVSAKDETYIGIVTGKVNPMMAFTLGKVKVSGKMGDVMKLNDAKIFRR